MRQVHRQQHFGCLTTSHELRFQTTAAVSTGAVAVGITGGNHSASPISYTVDGRQYVALTAGNVLYSFALPE